jgi:hypothetical protein
MSCKSLRHGAEVRKAQSPNNVLSDSLRDIARVFKESAQKSIPHASKKDRADLISAADLLTDSVESLITIVGAYERATLLITEAWNELTPEDRAAWINLGPFLPNGLIHVSGLLWAVAKIRDSLPREARQELDRMRKALTANATNAKRQKSEWIDEVIEKHAEPVFFKHPNWKPGRVASQISASVNEDLKNKDPNCSVQSDAIRKRLKKTLARG